MKMLNRLVAMNFKNNFIYISFKILTFTPNIKILMYFQALIMKAVKFSKGKMKKQVVFF